MKNRIAHLFEKDSPDEDWEYFNDLRDDMITQMAACASRTMNKSGGQLDKSVMVAAFLWALVDFEIRCEPAGLIRPEKWGAFCQKFYDLAKKTHGEDSDPTS